MFCTKCGASVEENMVFCTKCGNYLGTNKTENIKDYDIKNKEEIKPEIRKYSEQNNIYLSEEENDKNELNNIGMPQQVNNYGMQGNMGMPQQANNYGMQSNIGMPQQVNNYGMQSNIGMPQQQLNYNYQYPVRKNNTLKMVLAGLGIGFAALTIVVLAISSIGSTAKYFFSENVYVDEDGNVKVVSGKGKYKTVIETDKVYNGVDIRTVEEAHKLISDDSVKQKDTTSDEIKAIENELINDYGIVAVNLCELDLDFAKEISNVFKKVYAEYPGAREDLTNLSLSNMSLSSNTIACFYPIKKFATSTSKIGLPMVMKTEIDLNSAYFLNIRRIESTVKDCSKEGHFPPNTTRYSPVAHEVGHYISFLAMMKHYNTDSVLIIDENNYETYHAIYEDFDQDKYSLTMIKEAYEMYKNDTNENPDFTQWRASISKYAIAKDSEGNYIYDETIAEAFHDVYLNGDNAKPASKYVIKVLKSKLER